MVVSGLALLGKEHYAMKIRALMAEDHAQELQDLLCAFFAENDKGAETFLREVAADWAAEFSRRRASGKAAA